MVSATKWRVDAIVNIANFLSEIAPVHELYKYSMESEGEDSEHDVFGHANNIHNFFSRILDISLSLLTEHCSFI